MNKTITLTSGRTCQLSPQKMIGSGGEAEIFDIGRGQVFKLYKSPDHRDFVGDLDGKRGAEARIREHQTKLKDFPTNLPPTVVSPIELGMVKDQIVGYSMKLLTNMEPLLRFSDRQFRNQHSNITNYTINTLLKGLHVVVDLLHKSGLVIGDFNDLNILVDQANLPYVVDADSMQFGKYQCKLFTERFVDPLLCKSDELTLIRPHTKDSDWYAFAIMLMQLQAFVHPYGGIHKPKDIKQKINTLAERTLQRISVFHSDVQYPRPALPLDNLPTDLAHHLHQMFHENKRGIFPETLLEIRWTNCTTCNTLHAKPKCPNCSQPHPTVTVTVQVHGDVVATTIFKTHDRVLYAAPFAKHGLRYVYTTDYNRVLKREDGFIVTNNVAAMLASDYKIRILGDVTYIGMGNSLAARSPSTGFANPINIDSYRGISCFDCNSTSLYYLVGGQLFQHKDGKERFIGDVLTNQTQFWVGEGFGFGFYQAGAMNNAFVFKADAGGLLDVNLPHIPGQIVQCDCMIHFNVAHLVITSQHHGKLKRELYIIGEGGSVSGPQAEEPWFADIKNGASLGHWLYIPTDNGLIRSNIRMRDPYDVHIEREFPDTTPWINSDSKLLLAKDGLYVVNSSEIVKLTLDSKGTS